MNSMGLAVLFCVSSSVSSAHAFTLAGSSGIEGWQTGLLEIHVNPATCPISEAMLDAAIDRAVALWNTVPSSSIRLERGSVVSTTAAQADAGSAADGTPTPLIVCDPNLGTTLSPPPSLPQDVNQIPGSTREKANGLTLNYGTIALNADPSANTNIANLSPNTLAIIIAHEIGHLLGLGHTSNPENLMYYNATLRTELSLSQDDIDGVTYLYPRHELFGNGLLGCGTVEKPSFIEGRSSGRSASGRDAGVPPGALECLALLLWAFAVPAFVKRRIRI